MKKAEIIEELKREIKEEIALVKETFEAGEVSDNDYCHGRTEGLLYALSLFGYEDMGIVKWVTKDKKLQKYLIVDMETNGDTLYYRE